MAEQRRRVVSGIPYPPAARKNAAGAPASGPSSASFDQADTKQQWSQASGSSAMAGRSSRPQSRQDVVAVGDQNAASTSTLRPLPASEMKQRRVHSANAAALRSAASTPVSHVSSDGASSYEGQLVTGTSTRSPRKGQGKVERSRQASSACAAERDIDNDTLRPAAVRAVDARSFSSSSVASSSSTGVGHQPVPTLAAPPASPTKERIRMAGIRSAGVGGSHFKQKGDEEAKIQVSVRIRGLAPGDVAPLHSSLATDGPLCSSVRVLTDHVTQSTNNNVAINSVQSSLVGDTGPSRGEKVYPFDHVFGPEADQGMIYQAAVGPVLNEVLSGYNCTVFAYGQTGTGKTHTMEGDLTSSVGTYSPEAGIIPRTLYRLFHTLELTRAEYSVHASFVELYNEELRDLLSDDAPQPLGGSGSAGLRMYEDPKSRGGVVIQGLEDMPMKDAEHGLKLLRKGSQKRQIAATRCNESSSRSHSVFSLTVYIKETTPKGEDVLRTGKLNLVDLAGSENIGRSGAENKRAREAGMINQSLLTLGRVINALVEKASHIPYRESKLTRLLQDSLGGRTKTCIIATVSPDRRNLEETLSTLDYALRAKSIQNKPEVNQRMTRAALIKEYVNEIERLKGDLLASREKNGIYLSPESWTTMQDEQESAQMQIDELRRHSEVTESKMVSLREQFEQNMQMLVKRESEAKAVRAECDSKEEELATILTQFNELREAATEERALREAYMRSEKRLHKIASSMQGVVKDSTRDVGGLFAKLERKSRVEQHNRDIVAECQASLTSLSNQLEARVSDFGSTHEQFTLDLSAQITEFRAREQEKLKTNRETVEQKLRDLQALARSADKDAVRQREGINVLADAIRREGDILIEASSKRNEELHKVSTNLIAGVVQSHRDSLGSVRQGIEDLGEMLFAMLRELKDEANKSKKALESAKISADEAMSRELGRLHAQSTHLSAALAEEREKAASMRDTLCKNVGQLVLNFCQERDIGMTKVTDDINSSNASAKDDVQAFKDTHDAKMSALLESNASSRETLKERERAAKAQRAGAEMGLNQSTAAVERHMNEFTGHYVSSDREGLELVGATLHNITSNVDKIRESGFSLRQDSERHLARYRASAEKGLSEIAAEIQSTLEDVEETCEGAADGVNEQNLAGNDFVKESTAQLGALRATARDYLTSKVQIDQSTGTTPLKRDWPPLASWSLVHRDGIDAAADSSFVSLPEADESLPSTNGNTELQAGPHKVHGKPMATPRASRPQSVRRFQDENNMPTPQSSQTRPSLPTISKTTGRGTRVLPLNERGHNRMSMVAPKTGRPTLQASTAKSRVPAPRSRSNSVSKSARPVH